MSTAARPKRSRTERSRAERPEADDLERRRALGQFFTPADVAAFMWEMTEVFRKRRWHAGDTVIDPACGDGAFLRVAIERGQDRKACYGLDIDETLVRGWKSDAGIKGARLSCENGLENQPALGVVPGAFDLVIGNPPFAGTGLKGLLRLVPQPSKVRKQAPSLFSDQAGETPAANANGQPPEISSEERKRLERLVRELAGYRCWRLCDEKEEAGEPPDAAGGGLFSGVDSSAKPAKRAAEYERMAKAVLSTPADRPLNAALPDVREAIRRMSSTAIEVFFTERFIQLVRPGGMVAVIVPESILASDQLGPLRLWLLQRVQLLAVISLPYKVFSGVGANARTSVLFVRRYTSAEERANAKAKENSQGIGLTPNLKKAKVLLVSPNEKDADWSLGSYLSAVLARARELHQPTKESKW
jgi:hypothetical protein